MMEHLTAVLEETENDMTAGEAANGQDDFEHGEKIRVDRRKLEQMLQENGDESGITADIFFKQVMHETGTTINWPSKLKIGAKSKKDPHIKIAGLPENIKKAKDMVVAKLESKANRVTLKMDVSHTDHSHIIGRRGQSINKVMDETSCHIHFPDSNRGSSSVEKSNQVSITGQPEGVERARARIREMLPLVLCFEIPNYDNLFLPLDPMLPSIQNIAQTFDVTFTAKGRTHMTIRGSQDKAAYIQDALACLSKQLTGSLELLNVVQLHLDVAPQHHMYLIGRSACNIREIMQQTNTKIELPDPRSSTSRNGAITVTGSIPAVIQARSLLVNCLPLLLMFDLKEDEARNLQESPDKVRLLMDKFGVTIAIKSKPKQSSKSVTIKSKECNAPNMYLTRLEILGNPMDPLILRHPSSLTLQFDQPSNPWFARIQTSPSSSPLASPTPLSIRSDSPISLSRRTPPPGHNRVPPGFESRWSHRRSESFNGDFHRRSNSAETDLSKIVRGAASEGGSPTQSFDFSVPRRNSEPTPYADVWKSSPTSSQSKAPGSTPSRMSNSKQRFTLLDGIKNAGSHRQLLDSHGSNPASSFDSLASTSLNFDRVMDQAPQNKFVDYEKKKDISTELMTRKVAHPEVRTPTDQWSGLHLSKSADLHAFKKEPAKVEKEVTERQSPSREMVKSELDRAVMRKPSASMQARTQVPRDTKESHIPLLKEVLGLYGVGDLAEQFKVLEIDSLDVFLSLTKEDLKEAGFEPLGQRKKIENAIEAMKKIRDDAIMKNSLAYRAQSYHVSNPLEFASRSGRY